MHCRALVFLYAAALPMILLLRPTCSELFVCVILWHFYPPLDLIFDGTHYDNTLSTREQCLLQNKCPRAFLSPLCKIDAMIWNQQFAPRSQKWFLFIVLLARSVNIHQMSLFPRFAHETSLAQEHVLKNVFATNGMQSSMVIFKHCFRLLSCFCNSNEYRVFIVWMKSKIHRKGHEQNDGKQQKRQLSKNPNAWKHSQLQNDDSVKGRWNKSMGCFYQTQALNLHMNKTTTTPAWHAYS